MSETIAVLGLGNMGTAMAQRLLDAGYTLRVYNRTRSKAEPLARRGAQIVDEPRAAVEPGGIAITSLADDAALEEVTLGEHGFLGRLGEGGLHLSTSTIAPATAARLAALHEQRHSAYLGAPVLGRPEAIAAGQLWIMLAGSAAAKQRAQPVLRALGQGVFDFGERPEAANVVKLALNFLLEAMMEALAEAFTFAEKQGIARGPEQHHRADDIRLPGLSALRADHRRPTLYAGRIPAAPRLEGHPARAPSGRRPYCADAHGRSAA
jgi:3-hydroxyisobutyrate dehydrogenase-like beta-hydroxyacid dehydrogenase